MIKLNKQWAATRTVIGLGAVLGLSACAPTTTQPWLGRTYQSPAPQTYQYRVPQAQPYNYQPSRPQSPSQRPPQSYQQGRLPEAQPPQYVPLPPSVRPYGNRSPQRPATPVATTRPLWEEENVRVQRLPAQRPTPRPAPRPAPRPEPPQATASAPVQSSESTGDRGASSASSTDDPGNRYMDMAAVQVLTTQANSAVQAEQWGSAGDALERALRIQPDNPRLWLRLGEVYKEQGNTQQAAEMGRKAMRIAPGDAYIARRAGLLLK